jgi:hypothetical protein
MSPVPERLPEHAELHFVETILTGIVHLEVRLPVWARQDEPVETITMGDGTGRVLKALLETPTVVLCGLPTHPYAETKHQFTTCFDDRKLCKRCYRLLHEEDQGRAFEHDQPNVKEE